MNSQDLYTWCSLDALFIPGLIGQTAEVESTCPVTNEMIQLTVTTEGVTKYHPPDTVLSITIPGLSCRTGDDKGKTGPKSDACSQMHFFRSRGAAETWLQDHPGVAVFTVEEAWQLAYRNWIARRRRLFNS